MGELGLKGCSPSTVKSQEIVQRHKNKDRTLKGKGTILLQTLKEYMRKEKRESAS